tara:strand:- start:1149 stop:1946 length:798 start_codon:yes stop_codon:yes gene_type:complete
MTTPQQLAFNNQLFVQQLDAALINAHLPPDTLRAMIQQVNELLSCDLECQQQRQIVNLYDDMIKKDKLAKASKQAAETARQAFLKSESGNISNTIKEGFVQNSCGPQGCVQAAQDTLNTQRNDVLQPLTNWLIEKQQTISTLLTNYKSSYDSLGGFAARVLIDQQENFDYLKNSYDGKLKHLNTTERRLFYEMEFIDRQRYYKKILYILYYSLLTIFALIQLFSKGAFKKIKFWLQLSFLIVFPYLIMYFVKLIYWLLTYFRYIT